jgi:hypothetical protein
LHTVESFKINWLNSFIGAVGIMLLVFALSGCTRSSVPASQVTPMPPHASATEEPARPTFVPFEVSDTYSVAWIAREQELEVHNPAGVAGTVVGRLDFDARGIQLTGLSTSLGSSLWVEIEAAAGQRGWVNFWNLTEDVASEAFCADERAYQLVRRTIDAILTSDGAALASLANPRRGLMIRQEWWNPEVNLSQQDLESIFEDRQSYDWGEQSGGEFRVTGSFPDVILPLLKDVLEAGSAPSCDWFESGVSSTPAEWPSEYENLHYYAFFRPAPEKGNRYDWRAWGFGIEYVRGIPYLTSLVHFHGDV